MPQFSPHSARLAVIPTVLLAVLAFPGPAHQAHAQQPAPPAIPGGHAADPDEVVAPTVETDPAAAPPPLHTDGPSDVLPPGSATAGPDDRTSAGSSPGSARASAPSPASGEPALVIREEVTERQLDSSREPPPAAATLLRLPSLCGPVGLLHLSTAEVGRPRQLRLGLHGEFFADQDFLIAGDSNQRLAGGLVVGYTLRRDLELFGALLNSSNRNQRARQLDDRDPELIKTFGDLILGAKWSTSLSSSATFGAELGLKFLSSVSELAISPSSTSWWVGPLFSYDLRPGLNVPLRAHAAASFYADNSSNLHRFSGATRATKEAAMFGYGMAPSRLRLALAIDAPLDKLFPRVPLLPFVEYHLAYVTADADADFQDYMPPNCGAAVPGGKPCTDNRDMQFLTLGIRAAVYRRLTVDLGLDVRLHSAGFPYGAPLPPYNVIFGVSYPFDVDSLTRTVVVTRTVERPGAPPTGGPPRGHLQGVVRSAAGGLPVAGALVAVVGHARARAATDADGGFATPEVPVGPVELEITAPEFTPVRLTATVVAGQRSEVAVQLAPAPPAVGKVHGRVTDPTGAGLQASIKLVGATLAELKCDPAGAYASALPPGTYQLRVDAPGAASQTAQVEARAGEDKQLDFVLRALGAADPNVSLGAGRILVKKPIRFAGPSPQLTAASQHLLDGVADVLTAHPEIQRVRISAHWDSSLPRPQAVQLTRTQAEAVRAYLVGRGVAETRVTAAGEGAARPLVPNLSPANASRNRRVEFRLE